MQYLNTYAVALLLLSLVSEPANAQGTFSGLMAGRMAGGKSDPDELAKIAKAIKWAAAGRIDPKAKEPAATDARGRYVFRTRADKQAEIERLKTDLALLALPILSVSTPKEGQIGTLRAKRSKYEIVQILSSSSAVIDAEEWFHSEMIGGCWFVLDAPPADLQEGRKVASIPGVWRVGAKRKYETAFGAERMIHVLTPVPIEEALKAIEKRTSPKVAPPPRDQPGRNPKTR